MLRADSRKKRPAFFITILILAACLGLGALVLPMFYTIPDLSPAATKAKPGLGLWVSGGDLYVGDTALKRKELHAQTDELLTFARNNGFSELYWDLSLGDRYGDADTLGYLCARAYGTGVKVYAVLPALPDAQTLAARAGKAVKSAKPAGFVVQDSAASGTDIPAEGSALTDAARAVSSASGKPVGLVYDARRSAENDGALAAVVSSMVQSGTVNRLLPILSGTADEEYAALVKSWRQDFDSADIRPYAAAGFAAEEVGYQLFYDTVGESGAGYVLGDYARLKKELSLLQRLTAFAGASAQNISGAVDLNLRQTLQIGYPDNGLSTSYGTIYIMGISDPSLPLTMDGEEVERTGTLGCFGVQVSLKVGSNTFTFRQGDSSAAVTVRRLDSTVSGTIDKVTSGSRFPTSNAAVMVGETFDFRCVAPAGGTVTAAIGRDSIPMQQKEKGVKKGVAAVYTGSYTVSSDLPADQLNDLGSVAYTLDYNGVVTNYQSEGHIYAAGADVKPMVLASTENLSIISDYTDDSTIVGTLHLGARIVTTGSLQYNGTIYYKVAGGYLSSDRCQLLTEAVPAHTTVSKISSHTEGRITTITFACGTYPAVTSEKKDGTLLLHWRDAALPEKLTGISCPLLGEVQTAPEEGGLLMTLPIVDAENFWGYDIQYNEKGDLLLTVKTAPAFSSEPGKPLTGVTVMVDPGHGNSDCGALGTPGLTAGPTESELNLAVGLALQQRLEQLGATVEMVRTTDDPASQKVALDERVHMAANSHPDFFLSIHHNSTGLVKAVNASWMEVYYYDEISLPFASNLRRNMMAATGRNCGKPTWGYYYVTRLTSCPAVLFEVGYLPNPVQYEDCLNSLTIYRSACAMADAILESIPGGGLSS